jgi:hypothetical protein
MVIWHTTDHVYQHCIAPCSAGVEKEQTCYSKSFEVKPKVDRPDRSKYFDFKSDRGTNSSCCAATGRKLLAWHGVPDTFTFLMNTVNTLPDSFQQTVYKNTLAQVKHRSHRAENPMPAVVLRVDAVRVGNAVVGDYLTSEVA